MQLEVGELVVLKFTSLIFQKKMLISRILDLMAAECIVEEFKKKDLISSSPFPFVFRKILVFGFCFPIVTGQDLQ